ncbi:Abi family protein [Altererythrobacter xixiisoli]|uniref:Abi family protein n=1 Tax=Croceibacterium xixiisoli TaxID=1476466 RepID=A0A6I4U1X3_9SPHN|nr:Abi family protein [Croceibacterium xixiisoli]MXP00624.1 Abi family protein [Croceibacterium xixiisoli]
MLYDKPATTIDEQIVLLAERGMGGDQALMRRWLETVGYYRLSAYWLPVELPAAEGQTRTKIFQPGTMFEAIVDIYVFDRKLRLLVMEGIERIEIALRSRWTNRLTLAHGSHAHLAVSVFQSGYDHIGLLSALANRAKDSNEVFVEHYRQKYAEPFMPPLWIVTELMTFGELSRWFALTKDLKVKSAVARDLGLPSREVLEGTLQLLSYIRNICAHHGRLWNRQTVKRLPNIKRFKDDLVVVETRTSQGIQAQPANFIYNALVALVHMLRHQSPDTSFAQRVTALVKTRSPDQLRAMGFPTDWQARPCWSA